MRITVVGLGAVGGLLAGRLAAAGHQVSALARGATLAALRERGLRLRSAQGEATLPLPASDTAADFGTQQLVVVALKGPALAAAAPALAPLIGPRTIVMPAMNGVPWWFLQTLPADRLPALGEPRLRSVDPGGVIERALPLAQVIGCVVHLTCSSPQPGVVQHGHGERLIIGEPAGGGSPRLVALREALAVPGLQVEASDDIRRDTWFKLWGNMTMNPVSALTGATCDRILADPLVHRFLLATMAEAAEIGRRIGCPIEQSGTERLAIARELGAFKTSMLQDSEAGRPIELDALVAAVHEIGERVGVDMPQIGALLGLTRLLARTRGLYPAG